MGHRMQKVCFSTHLRQLEGYLGFTDLIKNLSIGFEYVTDWPFAGPNGANF